MKTSHGLVLLVAGLLVGLCVGGSVTGPSANAQVTPIAVTAQRFQISAWGFSGPRADTGPASSPAQAARGCYIVDTMTGELWHAAANGQPQKVSQKLP